jgi:hypothetical protein
LWLSGRQGDYTWPTGGPGAESSTRSQRIALQRGQPQAVAPSGVCAHGRASAGSLAFSEVIWLFAQTVKEVVDGGSRWLNGAAFSRRPSAGKSHGEKQRLELRFHALLAKNATQRLELVMSILLEQILQGTVQSSNLDGYGPTLLPNWTVRIPGCISLFGRPFCNGTGLLFCLPVGREPPVVDCRMRACCVGLPAGSEATGTLRPPAELVSSASHAG